MRNKLATIAVLLGGLFLPVAALSVDTDGAMSEAKDYAKDSVITVKVKARLAEEKLSTTIHVSVDTNNEGMVQLTGTARSQAEIARAGSITRSVEGVVSVDNRLKLAKSGAQVMPMTGTDEQRADTRIRDMHAKLAITPEQETQWAKIAETMRTNAKEMDTLSRARASHPDRTAIDDLDSYGEIAVAHATGIKNFTPLFKDLYAGMSDVQKRRADELFRHGMRKTS